MVSFPPCKINLGLQITGRRSDGYHDIVTCFYPVPWFDVLEMVPATSFGFSTSGIQLPGSASDNLCVRAYEIMKNEYGVAPVSIHLHKILPTGAGLGGGSSDGAFALSMLNQVFDLGLKQDVLKGLSARLGSDCPFFIDPRPMLGTGRGEILSEIQLSLKGKYLVIVKPPIQISTATAYSKVRPRTPDIDLRDALENRPLREWRKLLRNDFEETLASEFAIIADVLQSLYARGAIYASLSGSGSAVYGIFQDATDATQAFSPMSVWSGFLD
jgi:4-diphosphocytidyl-2-C-methyl-D-erythritol kinase